MKPETKYSLFILALAIIWKTILLIAGFHDSAIGKYPLLPVFAFMLIGIYRGMDERRKLNFSDGIKFINAFKTGVSIATLFSLTYSLFVYFYITTMDGDFKNRFVSIRLKELQQSGAKAADIEAWAAGLNRFPFYTAWLLFTFIGLMVIGLIYSTAIARMMSRKHPLISR